MSFMDKPTSLECKPEIKTMDDLLAKYDDMINENAIVVELSDEEGSSLVMSRADNMWCDTSYPGPLYPNTC